MAEARRASRPPQGRVAAHAPLSARSDSGGGAPEPFPHGHRLWLPRSQRPRPVGVARTGAGFPRRPHPRLGGGGGGGHLGGDCFRLGAGARARSRARLARLPLPTQHPAGGFGGPDAAERARAHSLAPRGGADRCRPTHGSGAGRAVLARPQQRRDLGGCSLHVDAGRSGEFFLGGRSTYFRCCRSTAAAFPRRCWDASSARRAWSELSFWRCWCAWPSSFGGGATFSSPCFSCSSPCRRCAP